MPHPRGRTLRSTHATPTSPPGAIKEQKKQLHAWTAAQRAPSTGVGRTRPPASGEKEEAPRWRHIVSLSAYGLRRSRYEQRAVQCARSSPRRPATTLSCHAVTRCSVVAKYIGFKFSESLFPTGRHVRKRDKLVRGFLPNLKAS